jgi:hypothetical protein
LCGIGGKTIAEAKENISYSELMQWIQYRNKRGSLHVGMRVEQSIALLASMYANAHSKKGVTWKMVDFMAHADEEVISLDDALKSWQ